MVKDIYQKTPVWFRNVVLGVLISVVVFGGKEVVAHYKRTVEVVETHTKQLATLEQIAKDNLEAHKEMNSLLRLMLRGR